MSAWDINPSEHIRRIYNDDFTQIFRSAALDGLRGCVLKTPVDTGRLRAGWIVSVNIESNEVGQTQDKAGGLTISKGQSAVGEARLGDVLIVENNVEYGIFINSGTDKIAPRRMVERTFDELKAIYG